MASAVAEVENIKAPHALPVDDVLKYYMVTRETGLSEQQVAEQMSKYGQNKLDEQEKKSLWALIIAQFEDLLVRILLLSAAVSFFLAYFDEASQDEGFAAYIEPLVILFILIANAFVGVWQESNAEKALDALKKLQPDHATVLRSGKWETIDAIDIVPGDICEVRTGAKVPADMRLIELKTTTLRIEQSQLTGESQSVSKDLDPVADRDCVIQSKTNMVYASTTVSNGACVGIIVATGMATEIGIIQSAVKEAASEEEQTPLQKKLDNFGEMLAKVIFVICALVWLINYKNFFDPKHGTFLRGCIYYFKIAVALAVAAIPEGLPAVITTCLALGTRKMAVRNCIVRKLPSVETLGCTSVICSDKTGTLTTNEMCCVRMAMLATESQMSKYTVDGHSYTPIGEVQGLKPNWAADKALQIFAKISALCNESRLSVDETGRFVRIGEPTEAALRVLVEKIGCPDDNINKRCLQAQSRSDADAMAFSDYWEKGVQKRAVLEFSRDRKSMSVLVNDTSNQGTFFSRTRGNTLFVKGAPESILDRCTSVLMPDGSTQKITQAARDAIQGMMTEMAKDALRTLAMAMRTDLTAVNLADYDGPQHSGHGQLGDPANFVKIEQELTFVGMVGIIDPPRPECKTAIEQCRMAGISVIMITGDNKVTAEAIATKLGILTSSQNLSSKSFTGKEFEELSDTEKTKVLEKIMQERDVEGAVFSRTEPKHKQVIVKILKDLGEIAAMTGDGVNDAPALKQADIGIAMGITGTEVAKEASDMVLADDNFSSIVAAVEEGRSIYNNMKAFIRYLISSNIGEVASIFFTAALGIPGGLEPVQLLWVNLVTDGLPATALGFNPPDLNVMQKRPRRKDDGLISGWVFFRYMVIGMYVGFATVGIFVYWYVFDNNVDGHTLVDMSGLMTYSKCSEWADFQPQAFLGMSFEEDKCLYFTQGKVKASTLSLTVLVMIEMLNAFNALSEDGSLIRMPPWTNPWLILACFGSILTHLAILYIPVLAKIFAVCPLDLHDWQLVMAFSFPVIVIDEILKFIGRRQQEKRRKAISQEGAGPLAAAGSTQQLPQSVVPGRCETCRKAFGGEVCCFALWSDHDKNRRSCEHLVCGSCRSAMMAWNEQLCPNCKAPFFDIQDALDPRTTAMKDMFKYVNISGTGRITKQELVDYLTTCFSMPMDDALKLIDSNWQRWDVPKDHPSWKLGFIRPKEQGDLDEQEFPPVHEFLKEMFERSLCATTTATASSADPSENSSQEGTLRKRIKRSNQLQLYLRNDDDQGRRWFDLFDSDKSESLSKAELINALLETFAGSNKITRNDITSMIDSVWEEVDTDGDNSVSFHEFLQLRQSLIAQLNRDGA